MERTEALEIARALLEQPTAPFHEEAVRDEIVAQLRSCAHVAIEHDRAGNMIATYRRGAHERAAWAFAAHMDHPAWVRGADGELRFLGSVPERFLANPKLRDFGDYAMWDLLAFEIRDDQIHSRACDDLMGCAEIVSLFRDLEASGAEAHCMALFSRAEEVGFWGAIELAKSGAVPREVGIFSLETSTPRGGAELGRGPIVRVGDRLSIFNSGHTARLLQLAVRDGIPVQRCLLDGGACEATAYQLYGYKTIASSIALGNYHNCAPDGTIQAEYVAIDDYLNTVKLCRALVLDDPAQDAHALIRDDIERRAAESQPYFRDLPR